MKMLMLIYSGHAPERIASLLDGHHAGGFTEFRDAHGSGVTGRRDGTRAWPGSSTLFVSVVPDESSGLLLTALREVAGRLPAAERLHVAVLPTETFF